MVGISLAGSRRSVDEDRNTVKVEPVGASLFGRHRGECPFSRDGEDSFIVSLAEDLVVYRNDDARGLRNSVIWFGGRLH
jgi:hypothetical protein